jgi:anti-anti-sigma regulatory factor
VSVETKDGGAAVDKLLALSERGETCEDDVTLLLLTAKSGISTVDADRENTLPAAPAEASLRIASDSETTWIAVLGHAVWKQALSLRAECLQALEAGRSAVIDLGACTMLDSTALGTLHELTTHAGPSTRLRIQNVPETIRRLFEELAMTHVLSSVVHRVQPLPVAMTTPPSGRDTEAHGLVLHAHELLAALSSHNAEQFGPVIEALRRG